MENHEINNNYRDGSKRAAQVRAKKAAHTGAAHTGAAHTGAAHTGALPDGTEKTRVEKVLDKALMVMSVLLTLVIILALVLNAPIVAYTSIENGKRVTQNISVVKYYKKWKPLVDIEGTLQKPDASQIDLATEKVSEEESTDEVKLDNKKKKDTNDDGLDLDQNIEGQYTILFLGFDEGGERSDVNWVFQIDIKRQKMNIMQIPRDTFVPDYTKASTCKFNSVYMHGDDTKTPIQRVVDAVQENFGFVVDAYVTTECDQIPMIVDAVGGIPIELPQKIVYEADKILPAGKQTLNGQQSEWFVRFRHGYNNGDIGRVQAQRIFMAAAFKKATKMSSVQRDRALKKIYDNKWVGTNLSIEDIGRIGDFMSVLKMDNVKMYMLPGEGAYYYSNGAGTQSVWSVHKHVAIDLLNNKFRPYQNPLNYDDNPIVEAVEEGSYQSTEYDDQESSLTEVEDKVKEEENEETATGY